MRKVYSILFGDVKTAKKDYNDDYSFTIILIGDSGSGKSTLFTRFIYDTHTEGYNSHKGTGIKKIHLDGKNFELKVTDGEEERRITSAIADSPTKIDGIMVIFYLTELQSYKNVKHWFKEIQQFVSENISILLVGNKCDLERERLVSYETMRDFADKE